MASTIKLKNGSGAPLAADLVTAEPALDLTNKRLYTEDSLGNVIEVGTNPTSLTTGDITTTGAVDVTGDLDVDNINIDGNAITSTDTDGNIAITPNGTGEVDISKVDIDSGTIDGVTIGGASAGAGTFTTLQANTSLNVDGTVTADGFLKDNQTANFKIVDFGGSSTEIAVETGGQLRLTTEGANPLQFATNDLLRMSIDSSGNLLVSTTQSAQAGNTSDAAAGIALLADNSYQQSRSGVNMYLNRLGSDGDIISFRKDGATVGSIESKNSDSMGVNLYPAGNIGVRGVPSAVIPFGNGSDRDATTDLGRVAHRFRNGYFSGGVYLGGTGAANHLDDYEEGTWTPSVASGSISVSKATYTKVGRMCHLILYLSSISSTEVTILGLPFTSASLAFAPGQGQGNSGTDISLRVGGGLNYLQNKNYSDTNVSLNSWGSFLVYTVTYQVA